MIARINPSSIKLYKDTYFQNALVDREYKNSKMHQKLISFGGARREVERQGFAMFLHTLIVHRLESICISSEQNFCNLMYGKLL